jgi:glyceraldehyde 3-phosphate dehydrogenase
MLHLRLSAILHESIGIDKAILNTVHGYTASQALVMVQVRKICVKGGQLRKISCRSSTGAAIAVTKAFPNS